MLISKVHFVTKLQQDTKGDPVVFARLIHIIIKLLPKC
jgi:hypothetical protein